MRNKRMHDCNMGLHRTGPAAIRGLVKYESSGNLPPHTKENLVAMNRKKPSKSNRKSTLKIRRAVPGTAAFPCTFDIRSAK